MPPTPSATPPRIVTASRAPQPGASIAALATAALLAILVIFSAAQAHGQTAAVAATTANLNQRAGPGTHFPVLRVVPAGSQMTLYGCIGGYTWCDGVFAGSRGWFSATYLRVWHQGQYIPVAQYASLTSFPTVAFNLEAYWGRYYPNQPFYPDRAQWVSPGPSQGIQVGHFYNRLSPHGRWVWMNGQYVFVPIVNADWRPYTDGRWVWNQRYGWTWVSNEPFGWATYHYGRWGYSHRIGWFWVPGTRWAPAWVSWRYSGNTIAWAPLPPDPTDSFSFGVSYGNIPNYYWQPVPANLFLSINLNFNIIRDEQQKAQVLAETQEAGGVTEDDNAVVNQVLPVELVEQVTQEEVVPVEIALTSDPEAETTEADAGTVQIFTPPAEEATQAEPEEVAEIETVEAESTTAGQAPADEPDTEELVPPAPPPGETPPPSEAPPVVDEPTAMDAVPADAIAPDEIVCPEGTELDANGECVPVTALPPPPLEEEPVTLPAEEAPPAPPADAAPPPPPPAEEAPPATEETPPPPPAEEPPPAPAPAEEPPPPAEAPPPPPAPAEEPPPPPPPPAEEPPPPPVVDEAPPPPPPADEPPCPEGYVLLPDGTCALPEE